MMRTLEEGEFSKPAAALPKVTGENCDRWHYILYMDILGCDRHRSQHHYLVFFNTINFTNSTLLTMSLKLQTCHGNDFIEIYLNINRSYQRFSSSLSVDGHKILSEQYIVSSTALSFA